MAAPTFYNAADQQLYKNFQFVPQEKYRLGLTLPTDATEDGVVTDQGIVNTNAFANAGGGGDFNPAGNMFGEGTAVSPVYGNTYIDTVRREGPESRQAVEALINAGNTIDGSTPLSYLNEASVFKPCLFAVFLIKTGLNRALSINILLVFSVTPDSSPPKTPAKHISFSLLQIIMSSLSSFLSCPSRVVKRV